MVKCRSVSKTYENVIEHQGHDKTLIFAHHVKKSDKKLMVLLFKCNACTVKVNSSYLASDYYIETVELTIR